MIQPLPPHLENHRPLAWSRPSPQCSQAFSKGNTSPFDHSDTQPSSTSPTRVFSPISSPSSQSSLSDTGLSQVVVSSQGQSSSSECPHNALHRQLRLPAAGAQVQTGSRSKQEGNPRRTQVRASWIKPTLIRQDQRRQQLVEQLVDAATQLVALIWPESDATKAFQNRVISLRFFIRETLRRSRTSYSTLQVTLWYLVMIKPHVTESFTTQVGTSSPSTKDGSATAQAGQTQCSFGGSDACDKPLQCGRRMFLSALILASKFLQDRNFTARAWSKITGLPTQDIISNEFLYLTKISWSLHLKEQDFAHWNSIIIRCTESTQLGRNVKDTWSTVLDSIVDKKLTLQETACVLAIKHQQPVTFSANTSDNIRHDVSSNDANVAMASFNFPLHSSPFSTQTMAASSSPLVVSEPSRASTPSNSTSCPSATPQSMETFNISASPAQNLAGHGNGDLRELRLDSFSRLPPMVRDINGMLTPSPSSGSDRPDEEGRPVYPRHDSMRNMPTLHSCHGANEQSSTLNQMAAQSSHGCGSGPKPLHPTSNERAMRAFSAQQACTAQNVVGQANGKSARPKLSEAEFYAALKQEYRRQKLQHETSREVQSGQKRSLTGEVGCRPPKSQCIETALNAPCLSTPMAALANSAMD